MCKPPDTGTFTVNGRSKCTKCRKYVYCYFRTCYFIYKCRIKNCCYLHVSTQRASVTSYQNLTSNDDIFSLLSTRQEKNVFSQQDMKKDIPVCQSCFGQLAMLGAE